MATIQRPVKEGSVRTYQAKVGLGFVDILASEMDADLDTIYAAWNGGISTVDLGNGSVTYAKLAPDAQLWQDTGTKLIPGPSFTTRPVLVSGTNNPLEWGALTIKGRLNAHPTQGYVHLSTNALANAAGTAWTQDAAGNASWLVSLSTQADNLLLSRIAPGGTAPTAFVTVDNTGLLSTNVAGITARTAINWNVANAATGAQGTLADYSTTGLRIGVNDRWGPQVSTIASWSLEMNSGGSGATQLFHRAANAGVGTADHSFLFNYNGNLVITGTYAEKNTGTTWANPSDIRLKKNVTPYTAGLAEILALQPVQFEHNGFADTEDGRQCWGYLADDVAAVLPECVSKHTKTLANNEEVELDMLDTSNISLAVVNAVKELAARVAALEGKASA